MAPATIARSRLAFLNIAPRKSAPLRSAPLRSAFSKLAPFPAIEVPRFVLHICANQFYVGEVHAAQVRA